MKVDFKDYEYNKGRNCRTCLNKIKNKNKSGYCIAHIATTRKNKVETVCKKCNKSIKRYPSEIKKSVNVFCGSRCAALYRLPRKGTGKVTESQHNKKVSARYKLNKAVLRGKLSKSNCLVCDTDKKLHAHHEDYEAPLEVQWFCATHHHGLHKLMRRGLGLDNATQELRASQKVHEAEWLTVLGVEQ